MSEMPILVTKLSIPPVGPNQVFRQRLIDRLNAGRQQKLILVSAPAGYGKTTLISSWLNETQISSAWLSLDEEDNDPIWFFQYFLAALQKMIPTVSREVGGGTIPLDTTLNLVLNEVARHSGPFVLVLDDFHNILSDVILSLITSLLERLPPQLQLVLLSRTDPLLPLPRLRVRNQLMDIRAEQLRFTLEETTLFLNEAMCLELSPGDLAAMDARTEGWIAGLQLAALSMLGSGDVHAFVTAFAGSHHYIMDYLVDEVLKAQPEMIRSFLLQTSILDHMCGSLCNAVVEPADREGIDAQDLMETLEKKNLFILPQDEQRHWYRYHHLFADVLNRRLEHQFPHCSPGLHDRASRWYERNGFIAEAIRHSLAAGHHQHAIQLIEENGCPLLISGEVRTLQKWLEAIEPFAQDHPWLYIFKGWIFALTGQPERVEELFQTAGRLISSSVPDSGVKTMQGAILAGRAYLANLQGWTSQAATFARQALEDLSDKSLVSCSLRTVATSLLGDASSINGDLEQAWQAYTVAKQIGQAAGDNHLVIVTNSNLANILIEQSQLRQAAEIYEETLAMTTRSDGQKSLLAGRAYVELSQVLYEWNDLDGASKCARQSLILCEQWGNVDLQAKCFVMLSRIAYVQHRPENYIAFMHSAERLVNEHRFLPGYSIWVRCALAGLWISLGDLEKASVLIQEASLLTVEEIAYLDEPKYLILLRLLLKRGDLEAAWALSQRLLKKAEDTNRKGRVIDVLVLQALILEEMKRRDDALIQLQRALTLAMPEGNVRTFLGEGKKMILLLRMARVHGIHPEYVSRLLTGTQEDTKEQQVQEFTERLSRREVEVLKLIEAGCSNQEIAERLVISIATVKRHISNIYAKFGVENRMQAVLTGKALGLFE